MPASFRAAGTKTAGTTAVSVSFPTSGTTDDLDVIGMCSYPPGTNNITPPDGTWTNHGQVNGGTGSSIDNHTTAVNAFTKLSAGNIVGSTVAGCAGASGSLGIMLRYQKDSGETWATVATTSGDDATHGANRSVTGGTIDLQPGDILVAVMAVDTDTNLAPSAVAISAPGITFDVTTRRSPSTNGTGNGQDGNVDVFDATVTAGSGTVAPTLDVTSAVSSCGPVRFVRIRASAPALPDLGSGQRAGTPMR